MPGVSLQAVTFVAIQPPQSPKLIIQPAPARRWIPLTVRWLLCVVLFTAAGVYLGYRLGSQGQHHWQQRYAQLQAEQQEQHAAWQRAQAELSLLQTESRVQRKALDELQSVLHDQARALSKSRKQVAFYEHLLSPEVSSRGLRVFEAAAFPETQGRWRLELILVQRIERARTIEGEFNILLAGEKGGRHVTQPATLMVKQNGEYKVFDRFRFKYFQSVNGVLNVPQGFQPQEIIFQLKPAGKKAKMIESRFAWKEVVHVGEPDGKKPNAQFVNE